MFEWLFALLVCVQAGVQDWRSGWVDDAILLPALVFSVVFAFLAGWWLFSLVFAIVCLVLFGVCVKLKWMGEADLILLVSLAFLIPSGFAAVILLSSLFLMVAVVLESRRVGWKRALRGHRVRFVPYLLVAVVLAMLLSWR